jgi:phosphotransferase system enzyme I (PtsP)
VIQAYAEKARFRARRQAQYAAVRHLPAITRDGERVTLNLNAGLLVDLPHLDQAGAEGIGLFRTELQFMISATLPGLEAQRELYRRVLDAAGERPVVFRTLDLGGDKMLPYFRIEREENPALGWRSLRIGLDRPALLRYQVRALIAAAEGRPLNIMLPMVAEVAEFVHAKSLIERERQRRVRLGQGLPQSIRVGAMLEVPALAFELEALCEVADFVSVGTNDLQQFFFASDRTNVRVAGRYDPLSPALLRFLRQIVETCRKHAIPLGLCGEMAGRPLEAMALIGLGYRSISMPPAGLGPVKMMVRSLDAKALEHALLALLASPERTLRPKLERFAAAHGVSI